MPEGYFERDALPCAKAAMAGGANRDGVAACRDRTVEERVRAQRLDDVHLHREMCRSLIMFFSRDDVLRANAQVHRSALRSAARSGGNECVSTCRSRWSRKQ